MLCSLTITPDLYLPWQEFGEGKSEARDREASTSHLPDDSLALADAIGKASKGDRESFDWLVKQHLGYISREILKLCPPSDLQDVAQEVLIRIYQALPRYRHAEAFRWWVKRISVRACLDYWRGVRRAQRIQQAVSQSGTDGVPDEERKLPLHDLNRFLAGLSADDRVVFIMAFLDDLPHREIAALMGISLTATKVRCFRLRRKAREWFAL